MPKIILSYRRSDTGPITGRIYDQLIARYGETSVFMDIDTIPFGKDFRTHIKDALREADVVLAIMGRQWLGPRPDGPSRIHQRSDPVRVEIESAMQAGIPLLPVLIDDTPMPSDEELPETLHDFAFINAAPVDTGRDFRQHMERLIRAIDGIVAAAKKPEPAPPVQKVGTSSQVATELSPAQGTVLTDQQSKQAWPLSPRAAALAAIGVLILAGGGIGLVMMQTSPDGSSKATTQPSPSKQELPTKKSVEVKQPPAPAPKQEQPPAKQTEAKPAPKPFPRAEQLPSVQWKLQTAYPSAQSTSALPFAQRLAKSSDGRMRIDVLPVGSIVPAWQILDAVSKGVLDLGYAPGAYYFGKSPPFTLMTGIPFGFEPRDQLAFRRQVDVAAIFDRLISREAAQNVVAMPCGVFGRNGEMWLKRPLASPADFRGAKLRLVGINLNVYQELGAATAALPGGEIVVALDRGILDGAQFGAPRADLDIGLPDVLRHYHYPGFTAPATVVDLFVNKTKWNALNADAKAAIGRTCEEVTDSMLTEQEGLDRDALAQMARRGVIVAPVPASVQRALFDASQKVLGNFARKDGIFAEVTRVVEQMRDRTLAARMR